MTLYDVWPPVPVAGHFDLAASPDDATVPSSRGAVQAVVRKWCIDRALRPRTVSTVTALAGEAVSCGHRVGARGLSLRLRWLDLDRMRIELSWHGCDAAVLTRSDAVRSRTGTFDRLADSWGVEVAGSHESFQWFDVDTRAPAHR
jgi:hypothetical protein